MMMFICNLYDRAIGINVIAVSGFSASTIWRNPCMVSEQMSERVSCWSVVRRGKHSICCLVEPKGPDRREYDPKCTQMTKMWMAISVNLFRDERRCMRTS